MMPELRDENFLFHIQWWIWVTELTTLRIQMKNNYDKVTTGETTAFIFSTLEMALLKERRLTGMFNQPSIEVSKTGRRLNYYRKQWS